MFVALAQNDHTKTRASFTEMSSLNLKIPRLNNENWRLGISGASSGKPVLEVQPSSLGIGREEPSKTSSKAVEESLRRLRLAHEAGARSGFGKISDDDGPIQKD